MSVGVRRLVLSAAVALAAAAPGCMAASPWDDARAVTKDEIVKAMQEQKRQGYSLDAPSNAVRLQAGVFLEIVAAVQADGSRRPLRVGHEEYFQAFLQVAGHTPATAPKFVSVAHRHGEDFLIDHRAENVIADARGGPVPRRAMNVKAGWPPAAGSPSRYFYEDKTSDPHVEVAHERLNGYRILDFGGIIVYDDLYGITGRATSGLLGLIFRFIGNADGEQTRFAVSDVDRTQVSLTTVRKLLPVTQTVTIFPDGKIFTGVPENRPDLSALEARLIELDLQLVYTPRDQSPMPPRR